MGATLTTVTNILKDYYLPPVREQLNNEVLLLSRLEKKSAELVGNRAYVPLHQGRSTAVGSRGENGTLPLSGNQVYNKAVYDLKYHYGRVEVTGPSMAKTGSEAGAFLQILKGELDGIRNDLKKDVARQFYGDGSGVVATISSSTGTVHTLTSAEPIIKGQLFVNQLVEIRASDKTTNRANGTGGSSGVAYPITAINVATPSVTTATVSGVTTNDVILRDGNLLLGATTSNEMDGIQSFIPTGGQPNVGGINSASAGNEFWRNASTQTNAAITLDKLQQSWGNVRISGGETSLMIGSFAIQRQYYALLQSQVRFNEPMTLKSGFQTLDFMGKPLVADVDAPFGRIYFLDESHFAVYSPKDWHFLDEDGEMLKWVQNKDAWQAILARYMNLGSDRNNTMTVYYGITDATGV